LTLRLALVAVCAAAAVVACTNAYEDFKFPKTAPAESDETSTPATVSLDGGADGGAPDSGRTP
jgi:hypothetical protein